MYFVSNYKFWYALTWLSCLIAYGFGWSELNVPLRGDLVTFLLLTVGVAVVLLILELGRNAGKSDQAAVEALQVGRWSRGWVVSWVIVAGFVADFTYQGGIPFFSRQYSGFDITASVQATVGIPVFHVALIAGSIFFAMERADRLVVSRSPQALMQFVMMIVMLLLNNSRGYVVFALLALLLLFAARKMAVRGRLNVRVILLVGLGLLVVMYGVGVFGNIRSGSAWWDTSYINRIGRYQDDWPAVLSPQFQWAYTYFTSPLGNLNLNLSLKPVGGNWLDTLLVLLPDPVAKYVVAERVSATYQVSYLNATTGYTSAYYIGGGVLGMYVSFAMQLVALETASWIAKRIGTAVLLTNVCSSVIVIVFVFYNSFSDAATCFLIPLALIAGLLRRRFLGRRGLQVAQAERGARHQVGFVGKVRL